MVKIYTSALFALLALASTAAIPVRWSTDAYKVKPFVYECYHGETLDLASSMTAYGEPLDFSGKTARLYWQTNGMDQAWWSTNAEIRAEGGVSNVLAAVWSGAYDLGEKEVFGFIGIEGENYRAAFKLHFFPSPGFSPGHIDPPIKVLDFKTIAVTNIDLSPWVQLPPPSTPNGYIVVKSSNGVEWVQNEGVNTNIVEDIVDYKVGGVATLVHTNDLADALKTKIDMPTSVIPTGRILAKSDTGVEWIFNQGGGGGSLGNLVRIRDTTNGWHLVRAELNPEGKVVIAVEQTAFSTNNLMTVEEERDRAIFEERTNKNLITNEVARAIEKEADLNEQIKSISTVGRFLSTWDCKTGRPGTEPKESPMPYKAGDYYIVASASSSDFPTNYIPVGTVYTNGSISTTFVTNAVSVNDLYRHTDDGKWVHVSMSGVATTFGQIAGNPRDNLKLANELNTAGQVVGFDIIKGTNDEYSSSIDAEAISNILVQGRMPLARMTLDSGVVVRLPFSFSDETLNYFTFQNNMFSGIETPDDEYVAIVYNDYGTTKVDVFETSTAHGLVKKIKVNGSLYAPDTNLVVTLPDIATSNDLILVKAELIAETNRAQTVEATLASTNYVNEAFSKPRNKVILHDIPLDKNFEIMMRNGKMKIYKLD